MPTDRLPLRLAFAMVPLSLLAACAAPGPAKGPGGGGGEAAIPDPAGLKGLTASQLQATLGPPGFTRRDAPAEIWRYGGTACMLDLFLYDTGAGLTVADYTVRSAGSTPVPVKDCLGQVTRQHAASGS